VRMRGYWEGGAFNAAQVTRLRDGETIVLRDEVGRPVWAGGNGGGSPGVGEAEVGEWLEIKGTVIAADMDALAVQTHDAHELVSMAVLGSSPRSGTSRLSPVTKSRCSASTRRTCRRARGSALR
jgi:hypothetical protein